LVLAAVQAQEKSVAFSQREPLRIRWTFPCRRFHALGAEVVEARDGLYDLGGFTKGIEIGLHRLIDPGDRPIEGVDRLQMELEQEAVVSRRATPQRLAKLLSRCLDPAVGQAGQDSRIAPSRLAEGVRELQNGPNHDRPR